MAPAKDVFPCGLSSCSKNVTSSSGGICCGRCAKWFHLKCVEVTSEEFAFLHKNKGKFGYTCTGCSTSSSASSFGVSELSEEMRSSNASIQQKLDSLLSKMDKYDTQVKGLHEDVKNCSKMINHVDEANRKRIKQLDDKNEVLQKRYNRPDIVINGLPGKNIDLKKVVIQIFEFLGENITEYDLNVCCYINNRKSVLIKFNSLTKRNMVMAKYFKKGKLFHHDIDILKNLNNPSINNSNTTGNVKAASKDGKAQSKTSKNMRIYLNDHLTEKGGKLSRLCRDLRKKNVIEKFRILNSDLPRVKIHFKDTSEKIFEFEECFSFFEGAIQHLARDGLVEDGPAVAVSIEYDPIDENNAENDPVSNVVNSF